MNPQLWLRPLVASGVSTRGAVQNAFIATCCGATLNFPEADYFFQGDYWDNTTALLNAIRKDAPVVGGCREKNPDNRSTFER
jgi:hypothetical protein